MIVNKLCDVKLLNEAVNRLKHEAKFTANVFAKTCAKACAKARSSEGRQNASVTLQSIKKQLLKHHSTASGCVCNAERIVARDAITLLNDA